MIRKWREIDDLIREAVEYGNEDFLRDYIEEMRVELEALREANSERIQQETEDDAR